MANQYVKDYTAKLYQQPTGEKVVLNLLWGDCVRPVANEPEANGRIKVRARGWSGYVKKSALGDKPLLELYFIDVGQGDGVLIVTPDRKHILIDGGYNRSDQPGGKNAADFVDWKFHEDYGMNNIVIDDMIVSHPDADHYGGLWDLINPDEQEELDTPTANISVKHFYHPGLSWFKSANDSRSLGPKTQNHFTLLLGDKQNMATMLEPNQTGHVVQGEWGKFIKRVVEKAETCQRLSHLSGHLPGYEADKPVKIKVLGPIESTVNGNPALKSFGGESINTNGHSVTLRLDYGRTRIMLTGDLNSKAQQAILASLAGKEHELACDVAKSCHHGSDDCSFAFLQKINAAVTVISSGDSEGHGHPRPTIVGASAISGYQQLDGDTLLSPMVYSTEIARSYKLGTPLKLILKGTPPQTVDKQTKVDVNFLERTSGGLNNKVKTKPFWPRKIVSGIIYGLVNVRTDGDTILSATLSEQDATWDYKVIKSRFPLVG